MNRLMILTLVPISLLFILGCSSIEKANDVESVSERSSFLKVNIEKHFVTESEANITYFEGSYDSISIENAEEYPVITGAVSKWNENRMLNNDQSFNQYIEWAKDESNSSLDFFVPYVDNSTLNVRRADEKYLSLLSTGYIYSGGAHGYSGVGGYTFDVMTGREITLSDIIKDKRALMNSIANLLWNQYPEGTFFADNLYSFNAEIINRYVDSIDVADPQFTIDYEGVTFYFNPYELAPFASGIQQVTLSFEEFAPLFVSKLSSNLKDYVETANPFGYNLPSVLNMSLELKEKEKGEWCWAIDNIYLEEDLSNIDYQIYFVKKGNHQYLYLQVLEDNPHILIFENQGEATIELNNVVGLLNNFIDPNNFVIENHGEKKTYGIGEDGIPVELFVNQK